MKAGDFLDISSDKNKRFMTSFVFSQFILASKTVCLGFNSLLIVKRQLNYKRKLYPWDRYLIMKPEKRTMKRFSHFFYQGHFLPLEERDAA